MEFGLQEGVTPKPQAIPPLWQRIALSLFIVLNLATVLFMNQPKFMSDSVLRWSCSRLSPTNDYRLRYASWRWQQYAHVTGLNNRWTMFGRQSRFNWWYDIRGIYSDGTTTRNVILPLPNQSARNWFQRTIADQKERKFELNIYSVEIAREAYSRYIARQFPIHEGLPIRSVQWQLGIQNILPPDEAVRLQKLHDPICNVRLLNNFDVVSDVNRFEFISTSNSACIP